MKFCCHRAALMIHDGICLRPSSVSGALGTCGGVLGLFGAQVLMDVPVSHFSVCIEIEIEDIPPIFLSRLVIPTHGNLSRKGGKP